MKLSPFYLFLKEYQESSKITVKENLAIISAPNETFLNNNISINIDGQEYPVTGLHITVLRDYEEGTTNHSLYHMTIECKPYSIYRYEDKFGNKSEFFVREKSDAYKTISMPLEQSEHTKVEHLITSILEPLLFEQLNNHKNAITTLRKEFNQGYQNYNTSCFEDSALDIEMLSDLVAKGERLKRISFNHEGKTSTRFLSAALKLSTDNLLLTPEVEVMTEAPIQPKKDESEESGIAALRAPSEDAVISESKTTVLINQAKQKIERIKILLETESSLKINQIEQKIRLIDEINTITNELLIDSIELDETRNKTSSDIHQIKLLKIEIEAALCTVIEKGTMLLTMVLTSKVNLDVFGDSLSPFAPYIELSRIERMLKHDQDWALKYVLNYGVTPLNSYRLDIEVLKDNPLQKLTLLATAYHFNATKCMEFLIQQKANVHTLYKEKPLSHLIQQLPFTNKLRQLFFNVLPDWPRSNFKFYREMEKSIEICLSTNEYSAEERQSLLDAFMLYQSYQIDPTLADRKSYEYSQEIINSIDSLKLNCFMQTEKFRTLIEIQNATISSISRKLKNHPKLNRIIKLETREQMRKISEDAKNSTLLKDTFERMGENEFYKAIESKNQYLSDLNEFIFHLTLPIPKSKKDKKAHDKYADELYTRICNFEAMQNSGYELTKKSQSMSNAVQNIFKENSEFRKFLPGEYQSLFTGSIFDKDPVTMLNAGLALFKRGIDELNKSEPTKENAECETRCEILDDVIDYTNTTLQK
jgi:hypothetical protein